jgi:hypothetical protein
MIQRGKNLSLALEASHTPGIRCKARWENLDCYVSIELGVASAVHLAHAARQ